jgi:sporulation protein YlmC with PRC-barrel domain
MLKNLMVGVALSAFALSGAMAQSNPSTQTPSASPTPPSTQSSSPSSASSNMSKSSSDMSKSASSTSGQSTSGAKFVTSQSSDQWLASKFKGTDVVGTDDKKIGDVSDILFDKDGKIEAFIISVGGFLGVGSKDVAIAPQQFQVEKGTNGSSDKLKLAMTKDELKQAQNFEPYKAPSTTTGSATGSRPAGMAPKPATPSSTGK